MCTHINRKMGTSKSGLFRDTFCWNRRPKKMGNSHFIRFKSRDTAGWTGDNESRQNFPERVNNFYSFLSRPGPLNRVPLLERMLNYSIVGHWISHGAIRKSPGKNRGHIKNWDILFHDHLSSHPELMVYHLKGVNTRWNYGRHHKLVVNETNLNDQITLEHHLAKHIVKPCWIMPALNITDGEVHSITALNRIAINNQACCKRESSKWPLGTIWCNSGACCICPVKIAGSGYEAG